jgi:SecD/SecF fusion protein
MQNKGAIRLFAIVFALVSLYQLSFTFVVWNTEKDARAYAQEDSKKERAYLDSMATEPVFDILVKEYTYSEAKARELNLGLDLKGGMNVILEVSVHDVLKALSRNSRNPLFNEALDAALEKQKNSQSDFITIFSNEFARIKGEQGSTVKLSDPDIFGNRDLKDKVTFEMTDEEVMVVIREEAEGAIDRAFTVLRARIDKFGVAQPNIQRMEGTGRILVELPGVKEPERVKRLLQSTAQLEFWETYENAEVLGYLSAANERLKDLIEAPERNSDSEEVVSADEIIPADDNQAEFEELLSTEEVEDTTGSEISELLEKGDSVVATADSAAIDPAGEFQPLFEKLLVNVDFETGIAGQGPVVGFVAIKDTATVMEYLTRREIKEIVPPELRYIKFLWAVNSAEEDNTYMRLIAIKSNREDVAELQGDAVVDAVQDYDNYGKPSITMRMNNRGAVTWAKITSENIDRSVAVVLDDYVYSFPTVNDEIKNGVSTISGQFTIKQAKDLANILKAGKLPAPARIIQADVVGPSLGQEAIKAGLNSFLIALFVVLLYMIFYYNRAGLVSDIALLVNMFYILGVLSSLGAVLTLPGIAGIVLTIGMAVDANVLIYERIREELALGKGIKLAIKDGYRHAYAAIIDANITTLLTGVILYVFGTGPIRGFATTLIIGILTSLFSAIFITRIIYERWMEKKRPISFSTKLTEGAFKKVNIDFLGKRKLYYMISGIIIVIGVVSLFTKGLNLGVDFTGGRSYQVRFDQPVNTNDVAKALEVVFVDEDGLQMRPEVKTFGGSNQVRITTKYRIEERGMEVDEDVQAKLFSGLEPIFVESISQEEFFNDAEDKNRGLMSSTLVGPTIADDIRNAAFWSVLMSLVVIFLYILARFSRWQFSLGAVAAVFHDVLIVLSLFSIFYGILPFSLEIDQAFIAAILTVIGYSLNDTVVVFDRIRERLRENRKKPFEEVVNKALNSTLSRTINTSLTTLFVLLVIFVFGGENIRGFMFALVVGVIVGTYSSVCIATPVMVDSLPKADKESHGKS